MRNFARALFLGTLVWVIYRLLSWTWKIEVHEPESLTERLRIKKPIILAHWHGDEIALLSQVSRYKVSTLVSTSRDGELMSLVFRFFGGKTSRGSSTRGAVGGLKGLIRLARSGMNCSIAVDGPKGPIYQVKPGVFELSRLLGAPIFSVGVSCDRAWRFPRSWNQTYLPKPFSRISFFWLGPYGPVNKTEDPRDKIHSEKLAEALHKAHSESSNKFAHT